MTTVTVHHAKTHLSEILRRVEAGEEIVIARDDKPVAVLRSWDREDIARRRTSGMGSLAGKFPTPTDEVLFAPMTEAEAGLWSYADDPALDRPVAGKSEPRRRKRGKQA